jgi:hypothetical protein
MKKIGIALMLCWPALVILGALSPLFVPKTYTASSFVDRENASIEEFKQAFDEVAPKDQDVTMEPVKNTDLVAITARDLKSQAALDKANSVSSQVVEKLEKLEKKPSQFPRVRVVIPESSPLPPARAVVWLNILVGAVVGLFPAIIGLVLFILGRDPRRPVAPAVQVA